MACFFKESLEPGRASRSARAVAPNLEYSGSSLGRLDVGDQKKLKLARVKMLLHTTLGIVFVASQAIATTLITNFNPGDTHHLYIKSDGSLWGIGGNHHGQLGIGTNGIRWSTYGPVQIITSNVVAAAADRVSIHQEGDAGHSLFAMADGSLWGMGLNSSGQLGLGNLYSTNRPTQILSGGETNVTAISAGPTHSLFIRSDKTAWGMGAANINSKVPVPLLSNVVDISAGYVHSLFVKGDGSLWTMGFNYSGQLGQGTASGTNVPQLIVSNGVTAVAAGFDYSLFLKSDGSVWGMGGNSYGQLGTNGGGGPRQIISSNVIAIAAGNWHSIFLKSDGSLWTMGNNNSGGLGNGTTQKTNAPIEVVPSGVVSIAASTSDTFFFKTDGSLWGMGYGATFDDNFTSGSQLIKWPTQISPRVPPTLTTRIVDGTNLQVQGTCRFGGTYQLLSSSDLSQPLDQWTPALTTLITNRQSNTFTVTVTNAAARPPQFYLIRSE